MFRFDNGEDDTRNERDDLDSYIDPPRERGFTPIQIAIGVLTVLFVGLASYAVSQHSTAKQLAQQNAAIEKSLKDTTEQVKALTAKINSSPAVDQQATAAVAMKPSAGAVTDSDTVSEKPRTIRTSSSKPIADKRKRAKASYVAENRVRKLEARLDEQGKAIESTRQDIASTRGDLVSTRTELSGSIARTHDEVVALQRRGERHIREFEILKAKTFQDQGMLSLRLKKANVKKQYADIEVIVDDRKITKNKVNLYEPAAFFLPDSEQPVQIVINQITKDRIHGYVAAPKYRSSELATMQNAATQAASYASGVGTGAQNAPAIPRQRLQ